MYAVKAHPFLCGSLMESCARELKESPERDSSSSVKKAKSRISTKLEISQTMIRLA